MFYNTYTAERWAAEIHKERINEAKRYNRWASARKAIRELSKNLAKR